MEKRDGTSLAGINSLLEKLVDFFEISIISLIKKKENLDAVDIRCAEGRNVIVPIRLSCLFWTIPHICHGRHGRRPCKFFLAGGNIVLRTGSMGHLSKSPTTISKMSSNFGKIGLKKILGGVVLPPRTLFSPGVSFSQWTSQ